MKIIISHDVDHLTAGEHLTDAFLPKLAARSILEFLGGRVPASDLKHRFWAVLAGKLHNLETIMEFDEKKCVPSTFFVGVSNGLGLNYPVEEAALWIERIRNRGFDVSVHGIAFSDYGRIERERATFSRLYGARRFGVRLHYLRENAATRGLLANAGYLFDSSLYQIKNPFKTGGLWEFPLHIMDTRVFCCGSKLQNRDFKGALEATRKILEDAASSRIEYLTVLFHDIYFSEGYSAWKRWYAWLVDYFMNGDFEFINYSGAIAELERKNSSRS